MAPIQEGEASLLKSMVCRLAEFNEPWFGEWGRLLAVDDPSVPLEQRNIHRKVWEWACISQALQERGMLREGATGVGFAVGTEKLPALFASHGARILATDIGDSTVADNWRQNGQYAGHLDGLFVENLISRDKFEQLVSYRHADMRDLSDFEVGAYDFTWSACAMEHLGSLEKGTEFVLNSTKLLKPGGVAVHTTEYNLSSLEATACEGETVIYRRRDLEELDCSLRDMGAGLVALDLDAGTHEYDIKWDYAPYHENGRRHLKLRLAGFISTSVMLIVQN